VTESLWDLSLRDALDQTASTKPTPGGGSIAAVAGALGLGLVLMALEVTAKKATSQTLAEGIAEGRLLLRSLSEYPDRDVAAFEAYLLATGLPKHNPEEVAARKLARASAIANAANTPLMAAELCLQALRYTDTIRPLVHDKVRSDLTAGADILLGSVMALLRSVDINLSHLTDLTLREQLVQRSGQLLEKANASHRAICSD
jgi:formiminotetrahydrofolate cyclodeaminase